MAQTVIGVFGSDPAAETAVENLMAAGIALSDIFVHSRPSEIDEMARSAHDPDGAQAGTVEGILDRIERFFATLVGDDARPPEFYHYREVVRRGGALVRIDVHEESQLPIIFTVLETSGALDIDEHASSWGVGAEVRPSGQGDAQLASDADMGDQANEQGGEAVRTPYRVYPAKRDGVD